MYRLPSVRPCHGSGEQSPGSFHRKPGSMLDHSEWDSGFVSHYFSFSVRIIPPTRRSRISFIYHRRQSTEFTLEQATKAQRVEQRHSSILSLISALDRGGWSTPRPGRFTPGKESVLIVQQARWAQGWSRRLRKISPPPGFDPWTVQPIASQSTD